METIKSYIPQKVPCFEAFVAKSPILIASLRSRFLAAKQQIILLNQKVLIGMIEVPTPADRP